MHNPLISIISPVYNVSTFLERFLISTLKQTFNDFELICVDDCSTDNSLDILNAYANIDKRIKIIHLEKNGGIGAAINCGINHVSGETIAIADPDDLMPINSLEMRFKAFYTYNAFVVGCYEEFTDDILTNFTQRPSFLSEVFCPQEICKKYQITHLFLDVYWNKLFPSRLILENKIYFPEDYANFFDTLFLSRLFYHIKRCVFIPDLVYRYLKRQNSNMSSPFNYEKLKLMLSVAQDFIKRSIANNAITCCYSVLNAYYVGMLSRILNCFQTNTISNEEAVKLINGLIILSNEVNLIHYINSLDANTLKHYCGFYWLINLINSQKTSIQERLLESKQITYSR